MAAADPILIPYAPREVLLGLHDRRERWAIVVAHRRVGKTVACINELIRAAATCPLPRPRFAYVAPHLNQAKDIAWNYLLEYTECLEPGRTVNTAELWVELPDNEARVRIYGADNPDRLRGLYLDGVVLDEFGDMEPQTWSEVIRPALSDREGWAIFIGTAKGKNGFYRLWKAAEDDPDWFRLMLRASDTRILDQKELADARKTMSDEEYAQEYECSFDAAARGAYWAREIAALEQAGRIGSVPYDPALPVDTAWDLGMADSTVIWFVQSHGASGEVRVIDVLEGEGVGLDWYVKRLQERGYVWGTHYLPHDAEVREMGTGKSRVEKLADLGVRATVCPRLPLEDGIQAVRALLPTCWFDEERCASGIEALRLYRRHWDERKQEYGPKPLHDWTSHYADALRCYAMGHRPPVPPPARRLPKRDVRWVV